MLIRSLLLLVLFARIMNAQATITGLVHDSISRRPLVGAEIQLVPANNPALLGHTATSDSLGRFTLSGVPNGRYALGFLHPMLDSLGVDVPVREVFVDDNRSIHADLAIPSGGRLRAAICGPRATTDSAGIVVGYVRDAQTLMPVAGAAVIGEWLEITFRSGGFIRTVPKLVATTGDNGWFAMCNVPSGGNMILVATRERDSTGVVDVPIPADGFVRHDLYLGPAQIVVAEGNATKTDTALHQSPGRIHVGNARVTGTVVAAVGGKVLSGAVVGVVNGPQTRSNERGEWTFANAPAGTRTLEVRALGYYPVRRVINIVASTPPVRVALSTMKAVLDTVRISATRTYDRNMIDFEKRRRSGLGRYLTAEDIMRHRPLTTSDALRMVPGVYVERGSTGTTMAVRGMFSERCAPAVYVDGGYMWDMSADDLDDYVRPERVAGIEIYNGTMIPPQYQRGLSGCGSIVVWTK